MSEDEIREFLAQWVLTFGTELATWDQRGDLDWYRAMLRSSAAASRPSELFLGAYFESPSRGLMRINQAGLDFLKGGEPDE